MLLYDPYSINSIPRVLSQGEQDIVAEVMQLFAQLQLWRNTFASHWEESAELVLPTSRNTFYYGNFNWPGQKKTDRQVDSTAMLALNRFAAICDSLLTPRNMFWHGLAANDDNVMKDRPTREWFERVNKILFKLRYSPLANFSAQNHQNYISLGAFGNATMFIDALDPAYGRGTRYKAVPLGEMFYVENHQGIVDGFVRWFRYTVRQAEQKWPGHLPANLRPALKAQSQTLYNFLHYVCRNEQYEPGALGWRGMRYRSVYVSMEGQCLMQDVGGYNSFPAAISRYDQTPGEVYGRGWVQLVLPTIKTLNNMKKIHLKQGHRTVDPVLLTGDDGVVGFSFRPGALNKGGVNSQGKEMIKVLPTGNISISEKMMDKEAAIINDAALVSLFQILLETPQMTATEVIERANEKGILLAPTVGRQQSEYLGPMIDRELDIASQLRLLPPMPPLLREAQGAYQVVYTSPLSRAQRAGEAAGFMRTVESVKELVNITGDPSLLDPFEFDVAIPDIAEIEAVPESWMATAQSVQNKRKNRAQAQQRQEQIQSLPAQAAMLKAQSVVAKNQPGVAPGQGFGGPASGPMRGSQPTPMNLGMAA